MGGGEFVPMYNMHPHFVQILADKKCVLFTRLYGIVKRLLHVLIEIVPNLGLLHVFMNEKNN